MLVHLNIGSNMGDSMAAIEKAVELISGQVGVVTSRDCIVESQPWGFESSRGFYNLAINVETDLKPIDLLDVLQEIERKISSVPHRNEDGSYRDREIDIDIIFYGDVEVSTPRLTVPHPHWRERDFVYQGVGRIWPMNNRSAGDVKR